MDREKFVESIQDLFSAGQNEREIGIYLQKLGFGEKEAKQLIDEAQKGKSQPDRELMEMVPKNMEDQLKKFDSRKKEDQKESFKQNMEDMLKIMDRVNLERITVKEKQKK